MSPFYFLIDMNAKPQACRCTRFGIIGYVPQLAASHVEIVGRTFVVSSGEFGLNDGGWITSVINGI